LEHNEVSQASKHLNDGLVKKKRLLNSFSSTGCGMVQTNDVLPLFSVDIYMQPCPHLVAVGKTGLVS
jgi:hypothetical protein